MATISRRALIAGSAALPFVAATASAQRSAGTLRFGLSSYPPSIQPWTHTGTAAATVKIMIFRGLTSYGPDGKLRSELAESWTRDGANVWVFKLKPAKFQNGAPVTSADVKWTVEQIVAEKSTAYLKPDFLNIERVETPDPQTVRFVLKQPSAVLPEVLASPHAPIIAKDSIATGNIGIGAGPYRLVNQERGVSLDFEAFKDFHRAGLPKLRAIRMVAYADENLRVSALQAGDVDMIEYVPWQSMQAIETNPKLKLDAANGPFMCLMFNAGTGPFKDPKLRQMTGWAIRREEIVQAAFFGRGQPMLGMPMPKGDFFDAERARHYRYDPDRAKALLKEAGVPNGFECSLLSTAQYGMHKSTAEIVQQHLGEIGVKVKLVMPDWATRVAMGNKGQYEFCVQGTTADNNDPDGLNSLINGELPANISRSYALPTPKIDQLFKAGRAEFDVAKRKAIYAELEKEALAVANLVPLAWRAQGYGMSRDVTGFKSLAGAINFYSGYTLEETTFAKS
jgi:peptide/nickel transport system substrate-binding protein